jgi:hypothetical protein
MSVRDFAKLPTRVWLTLICVVRQAARVGHTPLVEFLDQAAQSRTGFFDVELRFLRRSGKLQLPKNRLEARLLPQGVHERIGLELHQARVTLRSLEPNLIQ